MGMQIGIFIIGTLGFAFTGAILYVWGYRKSCRAPYRLHAQMKREMERRIREFLAGHSQGATLKEIAGVVDDISVGGQLQGYKLTVGNARAAAGAVLQLMVARGEVAEQLQGNKLRYVLGQERVKES
jgi:hypothetical protein